MSDTTIRVGHHALYPVTSDDGKRMWASQPEPEAVANDVVFDSDLALIEGMNDERGILQADCERWSAMYSRQADDLVAVKARLEVTTAELNAMQITGGSTLSLDVIAAIDRQRAELASAKLAANVPSTFTGTLADFIEQDNFEDAERFKSLTRAKEAAEGRVEQLAAVCRFVIAGDHAGLIEAGKAMGAKLDWSGACDAATYKYAGDYETDARHTYPDRGSLVEAVLKSALASLATTPPAAGDGDRNVESVIDKHRSRAEAGLKKYGVTTERSDLDQRQWLMHLQEELMDAAVYIEAALAKPCTV